MKKNLFGAVAVGLALALAFTACESGNDDPVWRAPLPYTRANYGYDPVAAAENGDVFVYTAKPTNILWNLEKRPSTTPVTGDAWAFEGTVDDGYIITPTGEKTYKDGVQAYNVCTGTFTNKEDYTLAAGKVVNTLDESIVFNAAEGTFGWYKNSSLFDCKEVIFVTDTAYAALNGKAGYERIEGEPAVGYNINNAIRDAESNYGTDSPEYKAAYSFREADGKKVYHVITSVTIAGFTIGADKYVTEDGTVLYSDDISDPADVESAPAATGTFKIKGTYAKGEILITSWNDGTKLYVFDDDAGSYTVEDVEDVSATFTPGYANNPLDEDIKRDFPETTTDPSHREPTYNYTASTFCKTGRTLNIGKKTVTANRIKTNLNTQTSEVDYNFEILFSSSNKTYEREDYDRIPFKASSYEYVLVD